MAVKILAFSGSARKESYNQKLVSIAAESAKQAGAEVTVISLADFPMPVFNQDFEAGQGIPDAALKFKKLMVEHDGFLIASPEYNSAFSPLLKNVIDWASRKEMEQEAPLAAYKGKVAAIMSASPGLLGGIRGLVFLRMLLGNLGVLVLPGQKSIAKAATAYHPDGSLVDKKQQDAVMALGTELYLTLEKLKR